MIYIHIQQVCNVYESYIRSLSLSSSKPNLFCEVQYVYMLCTQDSMCIWYLIAPANPCLLPIHAIKVKMSTHYNKLSASVLGTSVPIRSTIHTYAHSLLPYAPPKF